MHLKHEMLIPGLDLRECRDSLTMVCFRSGIRFTIVQAAIGIRAVTLKRPWPFASYPIRSAYHDRCPTWVPVPSTAWVQQQIYLCLCPSELSLRNDVRHESFHL